MILSGNKDDIARIGSIEKIDDSCYLVKYLNNLGEEIYVSIVPSSISDNERNKLFETINNPSELFSMPFRSGGVFHGYVQSAPVNSLSCLEFNSRLLEYLNMLYKYVELVRCNVYLSSGGKLNEEEIKELKELKELEEQSKEILEINSLRISPIWKGNSTEIPYGGTNLYDIYYIGVMDKKPRSNTRRIMEYCLASGVTELHGLYDYGSYGGPVSYSFICQLFGEKAVEAYKNNSAECKEEIEMINALHESKHTL